MGHSPQTSFLHRNGIQRGVLATHFLVGQHRARCSHAIPASDDAVAAFPHDGGRFSALFFAIAVLFALILKYVPEATIEWKEARIGALFTALLFTMGKSLLGLYLGRATPGFAFGAAGSLVVMVIWIYYSAQIFFFGAEFTRVYALAQAE